MKNTPKALLMITIFLIFMASDFSVSSAYGQACQPAQIVSSIYSTLEKDKNISDQLQHINIQYTNFDANGANGAIKIQGWVKNQSDWNKVHDTAANTSCVTRVNDQDFANSTPSNLMQVCSPPATKECGDICIPGNETCNIGKGGG